MPLMCTYAPTAQTEMKKTFILPFLCTEFIKILTVFLYENRIFWGGCNMRVKLHGVIIQTAVDFEFA